MFLVYQSLGNPSEKCFNFQLRGRVVQLLGSMKILAKYPVTVRVDNLGVIFIASNITTTCDTKHVDIWYKYVNEYVEDGVVKITYVKSAENDIDILIKT